MHTLETHWLKAGAITNPENVIIRTGQVCCSVAQLCLTLCDPMDCSLPGSSVHEIFQARILECVPISSSRGSSWPRDWTSVSCITYIGRRILLPLSRLGSPKMDDSPPHGDSEPQILSSLFFLSSVVHLHHVASKITVSFCIRCLKRQFVLCCYCCFCLFALMDQAFPWAQIQPHGHTSLQGETRNVSTLVPRKKGMQSCEQWDNLCQVRWSLFIYQRTTEPQPGSRPSAHLWQCDSGCLSVTVLNRLLCR